MLLLLWLILQCIPAAAAAAAAMAAAAAVPAAAWAAAGLTTVTLALWMMHGFCHACAVRASGRAACPTASTVCQPCDAARLAGIDMGQQQSTTPRAPRGWAQWHRSAGRRTDAGSSGTFRGRRRRCGRFDFSVFRFRGPGSPPQGSRCGKFDFSEFRFRGPGVQHRKEVAVSREEDTTCHGLFHSSTSTNIRQRSNCI